MSARRREPTIRTATASDAVQLAAIARAAYAKYVPRMDREPPPMLADFPGFIAAGFVAVIESGGEPAGYLIGWPEADAYLVDNIAIDPAWQGQGLARKLMDHAIAETRRLNLPAVRLYTNVAMTENLVVYDRFGFVETYRAIENGLHRVHMRLTL
ncbi:MAG: GNAT family N-acetyltransferase [Pseudolabrys sp.]